MSSYLGSVEYDDSGVPRLSADDIESIATRVGTAFDPAHTVRPEALSVGTFLSDFLILRHGAVVDFGAFPQADGRSQVIGVTRLSSGSIKLHSGFLSNMEGSLFRFTAMHEVGHWTLHRSRPIAPARHGRRLDRIADKREHLRLPGRGVHDSPRGWMEYQANRFATFMLMPRPAFTLGLRDVQSELGITRHLGVVWSTETNRDDVRATVHGVARRFGVSPTMVRNHLDNLDLLRGDSGQARLEPDPFAFPA